VLEFLVLETISQGRQDLRHLDIPGLGDKTRKTGLFRCARGVVVVPFLIFGHDSPASFGCGTIRILVSPESFRFIDLLGLD